MKIGKDEPLENDIISLVGMTCTGGALIIWAKETFGIKSEDDEKKENVFDYLGSLYAFASNLLNREREDIEEEETEQPWKTYARQPDVNKIKPGKYEINI
ncbi:hypothetical protein MKY29_03210 [Psychrobacillus sp. FSL K6-2365]|uniref:hypothetical protein n=1 Tax=Psychrobacillus sp. FSL K6-2365 TaxID=2921546 RepID=UPI0030F54DAD